MYARLSAVLSTCFPSITSSLVARLKSDVAGTGGAARRLAQARLFAELAKFGRVPPQLVVDCLKACIDGFNSAEVSVMCALLETCGQYLYAQAETQARMARRLLGSDGGPRAAEARDVKGFLGDGSAWRESRAYITNASLIHPPQGRQY